MPQERRRLCADQVLQKQSEKEKLVSVRAAIIYEYRKLQFKIDSERKNLKIFVGEFVGETNK